MVCQTCCFSGLYISSVAILRNAARMWLVPSRALALASTMTASLPPLGALSSTSHNSDWVMLKYPWLEQPPFSYRVGIKNSVCKSHLSRGEFTFFCFFLKCRSSWPIKPTTGRGKPGGSHRGLLELRNGEARYRSGACLAKYQNVLSELQSITVQFL